MKDKFHKKNVPETFERLLKWVSIFVVVLGLCMIYGKDIKRYLQSLVSVKYE